MTHHDRGRDGGTNFILRIKEQEKCLTLQEHDNDNDDLTHHRSYHFTSKNGTPLSYLLIQCFLHGVLKHTNSIRLTLTHGRPQFVELPAGGDVRTQELGMKTDGGDFPNAGRR